MVGLPRRAVLAAPALMLPGAAAGQPARGLSIGLAAEPSSMDPHFHEHDPSINLHRHVFEFLVGQGPNMQLEPELATAWRARDPLTWEFTLREGVTWHDGAPFTAEDVIASFRRIPTVPNSPSSFALYVRQITDMTAEGRHTLVLKTAAPFPLMPNYMGAVMIVPARIAASATTQQFNSLDAAIGTGPYRVVEYARGQRVVLEANARHWAGPPAWPRVVFRPLTQPAPRVAALLSGEVDLIEQPSPADILRLRTGGTRVWEGPGNRTVFFAFDFHRSPSPFVTGTDGAAIANPFRDLRVRQAMSLAINREAIAAQVMDGLSQPINQFVGPGVFGHMPDLPPAAFDPARARALLADAGLPGGFRMTIHGTSDRLVNDTKVLQALAQMFARVNIQAEVDAIPSASFFPRAGNLEFSFFFNSWGHGSSGGMTTMRTLLGGFDRERGMGANNRGRYANAEVDRAILAALETIDDAEREALLRQATAIAMRDMAVLPVHQLSNFWASRAQLAYEPRRDGFTLATKARPA